MRKQDVDSIRELAGKLDSQLSDMLGDTLLLYTDKEHLYDCDTQEECVAVRVKNLMSAIADLRKEIEMCKSPIMFPASSDESYRRGWYVSQISDDGVMLMCQFFSDLDIANDHAESVLEGGYCARVIIERAYTKLIGEWRYS